jgi:hypothetical protein
MRMGDTLTIKDNSMPIGLAARTSFEFGRLSLVYGALRILM